MQKGNLSISQAAGVCVCLCVSVCLASDHALTVALKIILYCVNCKFSILSAPPCGNHMLLPQCTVHCNTVLDLSVCLSRLNCPRLTDSEPSFTIVRALLISAQVYSRFYLVISN